MFTGIVEATGKVLEVEKVGKNTHFTVESPISKELKIDQSIMHDGACLTVVELDGDKHRVTAINETLIRTNLGTWDVGHLVNLERSMIMNGRLDGHIVQGHVDTLGEVEKVIEDEGSWRYYFKHEPSKEHITVPKGSICINGVSLTVVDSSSDGFSVAIIPYTYEHTNFKALKAGDSINLEVDIVGKYFARYMELYR